MATKIDNPIQTELTAFIAHIDGLHDSFRLSYRSILKTRTDFLASLVDFEDKYCTVFNREEDGVKMITVNAEYYHRHNGMRKIKMRLDTARTTVPSSFVVALVSQYDAFLGRLIQVLFTLKPDAVNVSDKTLSFSELLDFGSIEAAKNFILEKEVESLLRNSHAEQFIWLEKKFDILLKKDLKVWPDFIELTERRNLLVHTGGIVSSQYIKNCKEHGVSLSEDIKPGKQLFINAEYVTKAYECIFEIGVKLAHVLWRKVNPATRSDADNNLNNISYELIGEGKYKLAACLLELATSTVFKKDSSESIKRMLTINKAQAYKWMGDLNKANATLSAEDWSATRDDFKLAVAVLTDDFAEATRIMRKIGNSKDPEAVKSHDYIDWPLFQEFVKSSEFLEAYEEIFTMPFMQITQED